VTGQLLHCRGLLLLLLILDEEDQGANHLFFVEDSDVRLALFVLEAKCYAVEADDAQLVKCFPRVRQ
jgi:hypothetical protein